MAASDAPAARDEGGDSVAHRFWRAGRTAWAFLGLLAAVAVLGYLVSLIDLVVVPLVLALFPATLLSPLATWLKRRGVPSAVASLGTIVAGILLLAGIIGGLVPVVANQAPDLLEAAGEGIGDLQEALAERGVQIGGLDELLERAQEAAPEAGELAAEAMDAAMVAFETFAGVLLLFVVMFFYLKDGRRLSDGVLSLLPEHARPHARTLADRSWQTLGAYFRGQLLVALVDALVIGIGLLILGIPLAVPLAVLIFFGGLFPVVGAVVTGALAMLVALADQGLVVGLIVLGLVLVVQQLESNVLEPFILGRAIRLHPLMVLLSITAGALLLGILGAFLAVPVAAIVAEVVEYLRERAGTEASGRSAHLKGRAV
ncbi:AI-2E family transporter [Egibacter rhizosphaerae]|nr:AI-2E family transporter [Egibacter rhizosphaerae]